MAISFDTPIFSSDQSVDRVLNAGLPVLLVFLGGPASPDLEQAMKDLARQEAGNLLLVVLNSTDSPETIRRFGVKNLPALAGFRAAKITSQAGMIRGDDLAAHARYLLGTGPRPESSTPAGGKPVTVTDSSFDQEVMRSSLPVVVDFWAPWCGPCRMVAPALDKLANEWADRVKIAKVNVDENPHVAGKYGVQSIPTMMVVKDGRIVERWVGAVAEPVLRARLSAVLR